ncbi:MAG: hypothetical protein ACRDIZ_05865 [Actinomycetota bacterium]
MYEEVREKGGTRQEAQRSAAAFLHDHLSLNSRDAGALAAELAREAEAEAAAENLATAEYQRARHEGRDPDASSRVTLEALSRTFPGGNPGYLRALVELARREYESEAKRDEWTCSHSPPTPS